ncbi:hypothetical protein NE237_013122 [Protea cynaroides]|uniref:Uncharacterized protein n=1 Tax=Protea cynaroides TaxID=273540 RepID=A0A9Q0GZ96_9MAGN|nr:hypothetical protein NE237_013122 [Protea cynaroides]
MLLFCEEISIAEETSHDSATAILASHPRKFNTGCGSHFSCGGSSQNHGGPKQTPSQFLGTLSHGQPRSSHPLLLTPPSVSTRFQCQICHKMSHFAIDCYHQMDYAYQGRHPPQKLVAMADSSVTANHTWYTDTGATRHISSELDQLTLSSKYDGSVIFQDKATERTLYRGQIENGLYPIHSPFRTTITPSSQAHTTHRVSIN